MVVVQAVLTDPVARERELNSLSTVTVVVVMATVTMTFGAMIAVFFYRSGAPRFWGHLNIPPILWITTVVLLASSFSFERAKRQLGMKNQASGFAWMKFTFGLALLFLAGQVAAGFYVIESGVKLAKNPHSWFLFLFSGLHGIHIFLGLLGLGYLLYRTRQTVSGPKYQMYTRVVARGVGFYWHYLDFLWIVMFALLLFWKQ